MKIKPKRTFITKGASSFFMKSFVFFACFLLASTVSIYAQTKTVSGLVTDAAKEPLIGVSVRVQGTTTGTVTDIDGQYSLPVKTGDVLEFSFVGMKAQLVTIGAQNTVNIVLQDDATMLTETVVIGYGTSKKADLTGSIGSVRSEDIMKQPAVNAVQSVQGKISGVNIVNNDAPGSTPTVIIRGLGTALGGRNPLYIVDGFPADDIRNISPSDIVSMDVLKDASSASIYGVRAANGVIIVTTKKGQSGSAKIGVESYVGIKTTLNKVKMANASQYIEYFNQNQDVLGKYNLKDAGSQAYDTDCMTSY
jgi:TonB-dependent SusC/RagA subfamily outer membrane receptor